MSGFLEVYSTCPPAGLSLARPGYGGDIDAVAEWAEAAGLRGLLVFTDNQSIDPWAAAQLIVLRTERLIPLVAVQPLYMHPYTAARMVSTIACLYGRRVDLNLVAGSFRPHLRALGDTHEHDERYDRLVAYGEIMAALLRGDRPVSRHSGDYRIVQATLHPPLPPGLEPKVFVAGSSPKAADAAAALGAVRLTYPKAPAEYDAADTDLRGTGIRLGIIARADAAEAWRVARQRYPADPLNARYHAFTAPSFDADWHRGRREQPDLPGEVYWLHPFRVAKEFCPFLVGSYAQVGEVLAHYLRMGATTLILSTPLREDDLHHAAEALRHAGQAHAGHTLTERTPS
ncbi:LLM class flavin-dependent oxidoreductase [Dactylosporangium roseum]|uniref:LLM class flavin-dependent oxidoreductase n=1 Tax=Dactylosporangium roseum TaxID=47989 RepID=A0ABY5ZCP3_9ACTN|nr:LLM class flavin-dependent oxidoreductase [Dactylosporangium roseum]UWZ39424.1 LLM class flavin-dependent oxidoreductase [Dactylosporangium roseum]